MDLAGSDDPEEAYPTTAGMVGEIEQTIWPAPGGEIDLATERPTERADVRTETSPGRAEIRIGALVASWFATVVPVEGALPL